MKNVIMAEIWKDIQGYEGYYQVSDKGRIRRLPHLIKANKDGGTRVQEGAIKKASLGHHGYLWISLCKDGKIKTFSVHRLVALAHIPNKNNYPAVNHVDGNKLNNNVANLEWCTNSMNQIHASQHGLFRKAKAVRCKETGEVYRNSCEAERKTGANSRTIRNVCCGIGYTSGGLHWEWA